MEISLAGMRIVAVTVICLLAMAYGDDPEDDMDAPAMIQFWGYPVEEHIVKTRDGFHLKMHRIPRAFMFADQGYDVWLGNFRGNYYSNKALNPQLTVDEFWAHSYDEMAEFDLPGMLDYVLAHTGQKQLHYMGHSMGTMTMFALTSMTHKYDHKIAAMYALGPVATVDYIGGIIGWMAQFTKPIGFLAKVLGVHEFLPEDWMTKGAAQTVCRMAMADRYVCENLIFLLGGANTDQLNRTRLEVYLSHTPSGASARTFLHFTQGVGTGKFQKYDFGALGNLKAYGRMTPPQYNLKNIRLPIYLFYGKQDVLADVKDLKMSILPNVKTIRKAYELEFNHMDFIWGLNAPSMVYSKVLQFIKADINEETCPNIN